MNVKAAKPQCREFGIEFLSYSIITTLTTTTSFLLKNDT